MRNGGKSRGSDTEEGIGHMVRHRWAYLEDESGPLCGKYPVQRGYYGIKKVAHRNGRNQKFQ